MRSGLQFRCLLPLTFFPEPIASALMSVLVSITPVLHALSPFREPKSMIMFALSSSSVLMSSRKPSACSEESDRMRM